MSFNTVINQHSLRTKDGGTSPITSVLCVSPFAICPFPQTDMVLLMPEVSRCLLWSLLTFLSLLSGLRE